MKEILSELDRWSGEGQEIALATVVDVEGSAPRPSGARLCLTRSGSMVGSVRGGCVESDVYARALHVLDDGQPALRVRGGFIATSPIELAQRCVASVGPARPSYLGVRTSALLFDGLSLRI